jgi:hypothetical protein
MGNREPAARALIARLTEVALQFGRIGRRGTETGRSLYGPATSIARQSYFFCGRPAATPLTLVFEVVWGVAGMAGVLEVGIVRLSTVNRQQGRSP